MKILVVLTLAVFTGCHADVYADVPKPQLEQLTDAFWDYVAKATKAAEDTVQMIGNSQLGQEVNARITESADVASQYAVSLQEQLPPQAQELLAFAEDLKSQVQQRVEQLKQDLTPYTESLDPEALKATLLQKSEELKTSLEQSVKDLQSELESYTEELQEFQKTVAPLVDNLQNQIGHRAKKVQQIVAPYADDLRDKLTILYQNFANIN